MKILIVGNGAREHAIANALLQSPQALELFFAPGNAGTAMLGANVAIAVDAITELKDFAVAQQIALTVVGPELPLTLGIVDIFQAHGLRILGPDKAAAQLEASKSFSKRFMQKYAIPTAASETFTVLEEALSYLETAQYPLVVKADGLAAGKGVIICNTKLEAITAVTDLLGHKRFGTSGEKLIIETFLEGLEVSLLCFVDGQTIIPLASASDYKRAYDNDLGENTGGMGTVSPGHAYDVDAVQALVDKTLHGVQSEQMHYHGIIFIGLMLTADGPMVLEYNVRFGDPETESVLLRLETDFLTVLNATIDEQLHEIQLAWSEQVAMTVIVAAKGYPEAPIMGAPIQLPTPRDVFVFHAGTKIMDNKLVSNGGRVLAISALAPTFAEARAKCYAYLATIDFPESYYRKDIGENM